MNKIQKFITYVLIIGIPLNYVGEYMQIPLANPIIILPRAILALFTTTCDIIVIFLIHFLMTKIYKNKLWVIHWNAQKVLIVVILGIILVVVGEKIALGVGLWSYTSSMPIIPTIQVGFTPVLQLATLPLVTLYLASRKFIREVS